MRENSKQNLNSNDSLNEKQNTPAAQSQLERYHDGWDDQSDEIDALPCVVQFPDTKKSNDKPGDDAVPCNVPDLEQQPLDAPPLLQRDVQMTLRAARKVGFLPPPTEQKMSQEAVTHATRALRALFP